MRPENTLGMELRGTVNLLERRMNSIISENGAGDVTPMHGMILGYLFYEKERDVYQRDIETDFKITRSTVTNILQLMEKKGYVRREVVSHDARLKRLHLTERGEEAYGRIHSSILQVESELQAGISPQEYAQLLTLLEKVRAVLLV